MQYTKYIAPPKLKSDFLLGGLTLTELLIGLGLLFLFFSVSVKMAFIYRQNPYATFVASRTAWNQKEAHILPDQQLKGISILRPITTELIKRENDWVAVRMATNEEREKIAKGELKIYEKTYFVERVVA